MAKFYGIYVGTPKQTAPMQPVDHAYERIEEQVIVRDSITLAAAINDVVQAAVVGWETIIDPGSKAYFAALGAGSEYDFGDITYPTALDSAVATSAAGSANLLSAVTAGNLFQPIWQMLGYATLAAALAVGPQCELLFKIVGGAAAGAFSWKLTGARKI